MKKIILNALNQFYFYKGKVYNKLQSPIVVLMYHRVLSDNDNNSSLTVTTKNFIEQINYLRENYSILNFDSDWARQTSPSFVITFDDGYYDNYVIARDFLAKESIPSTYFISTKNIGTNDLFWWDELYINRDIYKHLNELSFNEITRKLIRSKPEQVEAFLSQYRPQYTDPLSVDYESYRSMTEQELYDLSRFDQVTIGTHTVHHSRLPTLNDHEIFTELSESKKKIERIIKKEIITGSFPYGYYNKSTLKTCRKIGLKKTASTKEMNTYTWTNPLTIPRVQIYDDNVDVFAEKMTNLIC